MRKSWSLGIRSLCSATITPQLAQAGTHDGGLREFVSRRRDVREEVGGPPVVTRSARTARGSLRTESGVWASPIVMRNPLAQDRAQMPLIEWNAVVKTLTARRSDQSFAKRVRLWDAGRCL